MFPPMPQNGLPKPKNPAPDMNAVQLPGVQPLGGGAILPNPDGDMMGGRSAGPMTPEGPTMQATAAPMAMPKPMGQTAGEIPMPKPEPQGQAKPNSAGPMPAPEGMPPPIRAPRNPGF